jgi:hypothetical protein
MPFGMGTTRLGRGELMQVGSSVLEFFMLEQERALRDRATTSRVPEEVFPTTVEREGFRRRTYETRR